MALIGLVMHFGRTVANIAHDVCRPDVLIGRDAHFLASSLKGWSDEIRVIPFDSNVDADHKVEKKPICCLKSLYSKLDEKSIIAVILPSTSANPEVQGRSIFNDLAFGDLGRLKTKGLLNATKIFITAPLNRSICTLVSPNQLESMKTLTTRDPVIKQQIRNHRSRCAEWCGADPCDLMRKDTVKRPSIWLDPNCYNKLICPRILRHDILHMPGSNKATREYQQTWIECPPIHIVRKPVCCTEPMGFPPICKRPRKARPPTADFCEARDLRKKVDSICPKVQLPCCAEVIKHHSPHPKPYPTSCKVYPTPSCCQKRCTPFPSFSECCRPESNKAAPVECLCLARPTMCEVYTAWRKKYGSAEVAPKKFPPFEE